ncbi:MAG: RNA pseudouridine synthase [Candidatus Latescibacterota bacterium]
MSPAGVPAAPSPSLAQAAAPSFTVLYEDAGVVAVDKPAGLSAIPERDPDRPCLVSLVAAWLGERLWVVHRLDKEVSGVILFARSAEAHRHLNDEFAARRVCKTYLALAHGRISVDQGVIERPVRTFGSGRAGVDDEHGKPSRTEFAVLARASEHTLVSAHPVTGRRHQLRVHFYSLGHSLAGDPRYGDPAIQGRIPRLMLHALRLECRLPDGAPLVVEAPVPDTFTASLAALTGLTVDPEGIVR